MTQRSNKWLGNSLEYRIFNKRGERKDDSLTKQEWFSPDPRFIVNECLDCLSCILNAFFMVPVLNFALVTLEAFLLRQQKHVSHLQLLRIPETNVDLV